MSIERPQLAQRLLAAMEHYALTFVQAPLGYGKTSALDAALRATAFGVARYEAAPWEGDAFVVPLIDAVRRVRPDVGRRTLALDESGAGAARVGAMFASDLAHVDEPLTIAIDDAQVLGASFGVFADALLRRMPPNVHLVIVSREMPAFGLADLVARERAIAFGADDMRFGAAEIALLARDLDVSCSTERLDEIERRTDGWPAGVSLALRTGARSIPSIAGSLETASAYLVEQLVRTLSPEDVAVLESVAMFESLDEPVLALIETPSLRQTLAALERRGAMVATLPGRDGVRLHPMLREVIVDLVRAQHGAVAVNALHVHAAGVYAQLERVTAALYHLEASGDVAATRTFLRAFGVAAIVRGNGDRVAALATRLANQGDDDRALVELLAGWRAKQRGDGDIRERFVAADAAAASSGDDALSFAARAQLIEYDLGRGLPVERGAVDDLLARGAQLGASERISAAVRAGWYDVLAGRFQEAIDLAAQAPESWSAVDRFHVVPMRAYAMTALGRFGDAEREIAALLDALDQSDALAVRAATLVWSARLALLRGDTQIAWEDAREAMRASTMFLVRTERSASYIALAEAATHVGAHAVATAAANDALADVDAAWYARDRERVRAQAAQFLLRARFLEHGPAAAAAASEATLNDALPPVSVAAVAAEAAWFRQLAGSDPLPLLLCAEDAIRSATIIDGADAVALQTAADLVAFLHRWHGRDAQPRIGSRFAPMLERRRSGFDVAALARMAHDDRDGFTAALAHLNDRGPRFELALIGAIATTIVATNVAAATTAVLDEPLTPREAEILALLAAGLTNKEIAQRLVVSPRTVETHVARVLGKLGVSSRSRAIARALAAGVVAVPA